MTDTEQFAVWVIAAIFYFLGLYHGWSKWGRDNEETE